MAQTAGGTYYAASSELVSSWPATSLDLANQLETRFAAKISSKVLQVVSATYATASTNNTNVFADTGLTATITPSATSSTVLVMVHQAGCKKTAANSASQVGLKLLRGSTSLLEEYAFYTGTAIEFYAPIDMIFVDSPSTTSATTYKTQFMNAANAAAAVVQNSNVKSTITLIELAG